MTDTPKENQPSAEKKQKLWVPIVLILVLAVMIFAIYHMLRHISATSTMKKLSQSLQVKTAAWENKTSQRPVLYGKPTLENAARFYSQAESAIASDKTFSFYEFIDDPSKPLTGTALDSYKENKSVVELVKKGAQCKNYKSLTNIKDGFEADFPDLLKIRMIADIMVLYSRELIRNNQTLEAIKTLCDLLQMGDDYMRNAPLLNTHFGLAFGEIGHTEIQRLLQNDSLSKEELAELIGYFKTLLDNKPAFHSCWEAEGLMVESGLKKLSKSTGIFPTNKLGLGMWVNRARLIDAWEDVVMFYSLINQANTAPDQATRTKASDDLLGIEQKFKSPLSAIALPSVIGFSKANLEHESLRKGLYILLALKLYKLKHQKYPDSLNSLAKDIIDQVPMDPFNDKPFIYTLDESQNLTLYSVGENRKDNKANIEKKYDDDDIVIYPFGR